MLKRLTIFLFIGIIFSFSAFGKKHNVTIVGLTFSPSTLTIEKGDTVIWTNSTGVGHNVNGTQASYPNNPESFGNSVSPNWTYQNIFITVGNFSYHCNPHRAAGMTGNLTVEVPTGITTANLDDQWGLYPNPSRESIQIDWDFQSNTSGVIVNINGQIVSTDIMIYPGQNTIDVSDLTAGIYFIVLFTEEGNLRKKLIKS
jgi:plastocyanin